MALSKRVRFEVFKRDMFTCMYCGRRPPEVVLEVDHVHPKAKGGTDDLDNLVTSYWDCNRGKAAKGLGDAVPAVDELGRLAAIQEASERAALLSQQNRASTAFLEAQANAIETVQVMWREIGGTDAWFQEASVKRFLRSLGVAEIIDAIEATGAWWTRYEWKTQDNAWRYFCGACWGMIREKKENT